MATPIILPKQGNSVEACLIVKWTVQEGDTVQQGEPVAEVETDKALFVIESPADGVLIEQFFSVGDEVPVMTNIAALGEPDEDVDELRPELPPPPSQTPSNGGTPATNANRPVPVTPAAPTSDVIISPRARRLAAQKGVNYTQIGGSGPGGRIIERDIRAALEHQPPLTRQARAQMASQTWTVPARGSGPGGRVTAADLQPIPADASTEQRTTPDIPAAYDNPDETIPVRGIRKVIAERMYESLQSTAQLTLNTSADARAMLALRKQFKQNEARQHISINDLLLFAVARTLTEHQMLNGIYDGQNIRLYNAVNLGMAVDTERGLVVPVIQDAHTRPLSDLATESKRLAKATGDGKLMPDEMQGGTFTVTNLGALGIESFTPIINPPQIAILGVGSINLKPVMVDETVEHIPHIALSLTIDHQAVDGAPAARFLQALTTTLASLDERLNDDLI